MVIGKNMNKLIFQEVQEKMVTGVTSQRLQECAKTRVKKCKRAKNWKIDFADVCIFFFLKAVIFNFVFFRHDSAEFKPA